MVCQIYDGLLVGGSQILNHQLVLVGESEFNRYVKLASITFFSIGRYAVQG